MRPITLSLTGNGTARNSAPARMDWRSNPFSVGLGLDTNGATTGFTVQHTFNAPSDYANATDYNVNAKWFNHPDMSAVTTDTDGNYAFPVQAIRLHADTAGTDTATLTIIQSGVDS